MHVVMAGTLKMMEQMATVISQTVLEYIVDVIPVVLHVSSGHTKGNIVPHEG